MPAISSRTSSIPLSGIRQMMDLAASMPNSLHLEIGDPNFHTPGHISRAAAAWVDKNRVGYPPNSGLAELREAIANKVTARNGIACATENVNVTVGATGALYLALLATIEAGDEVLVPDPGWAGYPAMVGLAGGVMRSYKLQSQNGFKLQVGDVEAALTPRTKALILNTPSNPTGVMFEREELAALLRLARERDFWIIADECYDEIVFDMQHHCIGAMEPLDESRVLSAFSFSKTYAMTGWRVGYLVTPRQISGHVTRMQAASVASASVVSQIAALEALRGPQLCVREMVDAYVRRRDEVAGMLKDAGLRFIQPNGALYVFVDIRATGVNSQELALGLLRDKQVCTTPGGAFGNEADGFIRISLACSDDELRNGTSRMIEYIQERSAL